MNRPPPSGLNQSPDIQSSPNPPRLESRKETPRQLIIIRLDRLLSKPAVQRTDSPATESSLFSYPETFGLFLLEVQKQGDKG